jgi:hypothetical protein
MRGEVTDWGKTERDAKDGMRIQGGRMNERMKLIGKSRGNKEEERN